MKKNIGLKENNQNQIRVEIKRHSKKNLNTAKKSANSIMNQM